MRRFGFYSWVENVPLKISKPFEARVGLARAIYSDAEVYLLDDPLAAVDSKVIFKTVKLWLILLTPLSLLSRLLRPGSWPRFDLIWPGFLIWVFQVASRLYDTCINGYLADKTRILVTHQTKYLTNASNIILMEKGQIIKEGTYKGKRFKSARFQLHVTIYVIIVLRLRLWLIVFDVSFVGLWLALFMGRMIIFVFRLKICLRNEYFTAWHIIPSKSHD